MREVKVILAGGLGNQLFQVVAAEVVAKRLGVPLAISAHFSQFARTGHTDWIDAFQINRKVARSKTRYSPSYVAALAGRNLRGVAKKFTPGALHWFFESKVTGYDPALLELRRPRLLVGYFQTFRFADMLGRSRLNQIVSLVRPSEWMNQMLQELGEKQVVALHVRRGDYSFEADRYGLLDLGYYQKALQELRQAGYTWDEVWVFTDDPDVVSREIAPHLGSEVSIVRPPQDSHAAESMTIMSQCAALVIANSTFSWWAGYLGREKPVVYPETWYRGMSNPTDLIPEAWVAVASEWR
jgi:hypothetical protein